MLFLGRQRKDGKEANVPHSIWFIIFIGVLCGFTTMIGNAAGPIFAIYLLSMRFEKKYYLGTIVIALLALPVLYLGTVIGIRIVKVMNEKTFRYAIVIMTAAAAIRLLF